MKPQILPVIPALLSLGAGLGPGSVGRASRPVSPADLYNRAYRTLDRASRFDIVTRTTYLMGSKPTYTSDLRFIAPHRALQSNELGGELGASRQVQVNDSYCYWNVGPNFRRIFCQHLSWDHSDVSLEVDNHPAQIHLAHARFSSGHSTDAVYRVRVTGQAGLGCPPGMRCPGRSGTLVGTLTIDRHQLRPLSFTAVIGNRTPYARLSVVYRYSHQFTVDLPSTAHVPCPRYAPPHGWCLSQHDRRTP